MAGGIWKSMQEGYGGIAVGKRCGGVNDSAGEGG